MNLIGFVREMLCAGTGWLWLTPPFPEGSPIFRSYVEGGRETSRCPGCSHCLLDRSHEDDLELGEAGA